MKTTVEIPDTLMRSAKIRAVREGSTLREILTEALQQYLAAPLVSDATTADPVVDIDAATGFPVIRAATGASLPTLSVDESYQLLHALDTDNDHERAGIPS